MKLSACFPLFLLLASCSLLQTKVDSHTTNQVPGFEYKFPQTGEWILGSSQSGNVVIGKKTEDGSSVLATVKSGSIGVTRAELEQLNKTGKLKAHSASEIIASFKTNIEADAKQGRVKNIKTQYQEQQLPEGRCLLFSQTGVDGGQPISNDGKWCMNEKKYTYIMMNISARVPAGQKLPDLNQEKAEFFNSLVFTK